MKSILFYLIIIEYVTNLTRIPETKYLSSNHRINLFSNENLIVDFHNENESHKSYNPWNNLCELFNDNICLKCIKGYFLYNSNCYNVCPHETYADNYSFTCKEWNSSPFYLKAYTTSKCQNSCDKEFKDCSCKEDCRYKGNCCSDFNFCELINSLPKNKDCSIENCKVCNDDACLQCDENYYFYNNKCLLNCSIDHIILKQNKICLNKCDVANCESCEGGICYKCLNGYFLNDNQCLKECPFDTRADKINLKCQQKQIFSFYWVFPSIYSCKGNCGIEKKDCSCNIDCIRKGNCCDDFEKECPLEFEKEKCKLCEECHHGNCNKCKENAFSWNHINCECKNGYVFNKILNKCEKVIERVDIKSGDKKLKNSNNNLHININQNHSIPLKDSLNKLLKIKPISLNHNNTLKENHFSNNNSLISNKINYTKIFEIINGHIDFNNTFNKSLIHNIDKISNSTLVNNGLMGLNNNGVIKNENNHSNFTEFKDMYKISVKNESNLLTNPNGNNMKIKQVKPLYTMNNTNNKKKFLGKNKIIESTMSGLKETNIQTKSFEKKEKQKKNLKNIVINNQNDSKEYIYSDNLKSTLEKNDKKNSNNNYGKSLEKLNTYNNPLKTILPITINSINEEKNVTLNVKNPKNKFNFAEELKKHYNDMLHAVILDQNKLPSIESKKIKQKDTNNQIINGNFTFNNLKENKFTNLLNNEDIIYNSNNSDHSYIITTNSFNKFSKIINKGNIDYRDNMGLIESMRNLDIQKETNPLYSNILNLNDEIKIELDDKKDQIKTIF